MREERQVVERSDGGVEVRSSTRPRKLNATRKRKFLAALAGGQTITMAAKVVGVSTQTVVNERKRDPQFDQDVDTARDGLAEHLETEAYRRAVTGVKRDVFQKGEKVGEETVYSDRLLESTLAATHKKYKKDDSTKVAVVVAPLTTQELRAARDLGRDNVDELDRLAREFAEVEREADEQRRIGSGG